MEALMTQSKNIIVSPELGSLESYLQNVRKAPMLSEEEILLAERLQSTGDVESARRLVFLICVSLSKSPEAT